MDPTRFRERLQNHDKMIGLSINYPAPGIIENVSREWDFLWLDGQHGQIYQDQMLSMVRTADLMGVDSLLRVPGHESDTIGLYADMLPSALMIPMVNTGADAKRIVMAARFAPLGSRSFGGRRPIDRLNRYYHQDKEPVLVAQIETPEALANVDAIAQTEGIEVLMFGLDDFKLSLGLDINSTVPETPELLKAQKKIARAAREAGKSFCCITPNPKMAQLADELGCQLYIGASDSGFLSQGSVQCAKMLKQSLDLKNCRR